MSLTKGVDYYAYVSGTNFSVQFAAAGESAAANFSSGAAVSTGNFQIGSDETWPSSENYMWTARWNGNVIAGAGISISPLTGDLESAGTVSTYPGKGFPLTLPPSSFVEFAAQIMQMQQSAKNCGALNNMMNTPSIVNSSTVGQPGYAVSYGFFDASTGLAGLTNQDQSYVYLTDNYSNWMGALANAYPQVKNAAFNNFVLAGAHDSGMCNPVDVNNLVNVIEESASQAFINSLGTAAGNTIAVVLTAIAKASGPTAPNALINEAFTQKDTITTMLNLGVRYFDSRPGYCYGPLAKVMPGIFHQHAVIPGYSFNSFISDIITWLESNPTEIVVVALGTSGFQDKDQMYPGFSTLNEIISGINQKNGANIVNTGNYTDLASSYQTLISANKRLIFLNQLNDDPNTASKYDSYSSAYETASVSDIMPCLNGMNGAGYGANNYTVLQLQGTAQGAGSDADIAANAVSISQAASPLMSTKAAFDATTYGWALKNVHAQMDYNKGTPVVTKSLIVLLNDFCDNALVSIGISITKQRLGITS